MTAFVTAFFSAPCLAFEVEVFTDITTQASYMEVTIQFKVRESVTGGEANVEVLRSEKRSGNYETVGFAELKPQGFYGFHDKTVKKTTYFYKLQLKGMGVTSEPFKGNALLVPPTT